MHQLHLVNIRGDLQHPECRLIIVPRSIDTAGLTEGPVFTPLSALQSILETGSLMNGAGST